MFVAGQFQARIRKLALVGGPYLPNAYLRVVAGDNNNPNPRLTVRTLEEIVPGDEVFLQRAVFPHKGSPQAPVVYKCSLGPPTEQVDFAGMPVVIWTQVLNGERTVSSLAEVFIVLVEGEE